MLPCAAFGSPLMSSLTCEAEPRAPLKPASTILLGGRNCCFAARTRRLKCAGLRNAYSSKTCGMAMRRAMLAIGSLGGSCDRHEPRLVDSMFYLQERAREPERSRTSS